jgi:hypothetical protein
MKNYAPNKTKKQKIEKKKIQNNKKKFPELKMMGGIEGKSSNYTMSSDDELFNFPPIKKSMKIQNQQ